MTERSGSLSLSDVAREAGVSLTTASRALNDSYGVSASTKAKVLATAQRLDYVVSPDAVRLAGGRTRRVALVVPHIERWFFGDIVNGLTAVLSSADLDLLLYQVDSAADRLDFFTRLPARRKVDAVVVVGFPVAPREQERLALMGVDIVAAGGQSADYPYVCIDDYQAGRQAVDHLVELGHSRIAMIAAHDPDQPGWPARSGRSEAYVDAIAAKGIDVDDVLVRDVDWGGLNAASAMASILDAVPDNPPTAVFAHSDELALGAIRTLHRRGLRVPEDVSVIGIDDHPLAELTDLTTVHQSAREQGRIAARLVIEALAVRAGAGTAPGSVTAPTKLLVRSTTGAPRGAVRRG
nr:LacI family DNA-binding transcriptional regulator [Rhodococcus sp. (in: high G+C Gram-positive bacteria)]